MFVALLNRLFRKGTLQRRPVRRRPLLSLEQLETRTLLTAPGGIVVFPPAGGGIPAGGVSFMINGNNFNNPNVTAVNFVPRAPNTNTPGTGSNITIVSGGQLTVTQPPLQVGIYDVTLANA